jgi:hypothetical protein
MAIPPGSVWREKNTGKMIRVLGYDGDARAVPWTYVEEGGWWYCDAYDFVLWGRFERVS